MVYDITSGLKAKRSLSELVNIPEEDIEKYITNIADGYDPYNPGKFIEYMDIKISQIDISELYFFVQHITTNYDDCESIKKYGLMNLQRVLSEDTNLNNYLKTMSISINLADKYIEYRSGEMKRISLEKDLSDETRKLAMKIYVDYQIDGFLCMKGKTEYGGLVHERPEILQNIQKTIKEIAVENKWRKRIAI